MKTTRTIAFVAGMAFNATILPAGPLLAAPAGVALPLNAPVALGGRAATLTKLDSLPFVESDYSKRFKFDSSGNPKLRELRDRCKLDEVIAPGKDLVFVVGKERRKYRKPELPVVVGHFEAFGDLSIQPDELDKYGFTAFIPNTDLMDAGYDYGNMFIIKDALCNGTQWHVRKVPANPATDPYFPIGQAAMSLAVADGKLHVTLKTLTPNFKTFETRAGNGEWKTSPATFAWDVRAGANRLEARTVNAFGVTGPVSTAELTVKE